MLINNMTRKKSIFRGRRRNDLIFYCILLAFPIAQFWQPHNESKLFGYVLFVFRRLFQGYTQSADGGGGDRRRV